MRGGEGGMTLLGPPTPTGLLSLTAPPSQTWDQGLHDSSVSPSQLWNQGLHDSSVFEKILKSDTYCEPCMVTVQSSSNNEASEWLGILWGWIENKLSMVSRWSL